MGYTGFILRDFSGKMRLFVELWSTGRVMTLWVQPGTNVALAKEYILASKQVEQGGDPVECTLEDMKLMQGSTVLSDESPVDLYHTTSCPNQVHVMLVTRSSRDMVMSEYVEETIPSHLFTMHRVDAPLVVRLKQGFTFCTPQTWTEEGEEGRDTARMRRKRAAIEVRAERNQLVFGTLELSQCLTECTFTPSQHLNYSEKYRVYIDGECVQHNDCDVYGNSKKVVCDTVGFSFVTFRC